MEIKGLFHNAYFGKVYRTSDNRKALFSRFIGDENETNAIVYLESSYAEINCTLDGMYFDYIQGKKKFWHNNPFIVSEWTDEENVND